jgi:thioredoxin-like negative regulator of GroEL
MFGSAAMAGTTVIVTRVGAASPASATAQAERPRLVFFYSRTSGLCRRVEGYLAQILQRHHNHDTFAVIRVAIEDHHGLVELFGIDEVPTIVVVEGRRIRARVDSPRGRPAIEQALSPWLR